MSTKAKPSVAEIISATLLVAGTSIGGGMLALPIATGICGFIPSLTILAICWLAMAMTALLLIEVTLWMEEGVHVVTMTERILGPIGKGLSWILFLFISYASIVAYTAGGGAQIAQATAALFDLSISKFWGCALFILFFGCIVDLGTKVLGRINAILFFAMILAYVALVLMGLDEVKFNHLCHVNWPFTFMAIPLALTTFSFQTMVPSLTPYLKRNVNALRMAVIAGTFITFLVYAIWQWLILGIVPVEGANGLAEAFKRGEPPTQFLKEHVNGAWISQIASFFAFFAIATSFLGMGLGLFDFLADGLHIKKKGKGKLILGALIIVPTLFFATQFERVFLVAMESSGGIGDAILNGMMPVAMVWIGRYYMNYKSHSPTPGGKMALILTFLFFLAAFTIQIYTYFM